MHFLALHHADAQIDAAGVPALLAYRNGDKFADILPLVDEVAPSRRCEAALESLMREYVHLARSDEWMNADLLDRREML